MLQGTAFMATIEQGFDARVSTPVSAVIAEDVYSAQGRKQKSSPEVPAYPVVQCRSEAKGSALGQAR